MQNRIKAGEIFSQLIIGKFYLRQQLATIAAAAAAASHQQHMEKKLVQ
jgi:hypothetical protein